jgi:hypothetical protein
VERTRHAVQEKQHGLVDFEKGSLVPGDELEVANAIHDILHSSYIGIKCERVRPRYYATNNFDETVIYAHPRRAFMIFKNWDFGKRSVWEPDEEDWKRLTTIWLGIFKDVKIPDSHRTADVIKGLISLDQHQARKQRHPTQGEIACVSHDRGL